MSIRKQNFFVAEPDCAVSDELIERFVVHNDKGCELKTAEGIIYLSTAFKGDVKPGDENRSALAGLPLFESSGNETGAIGSAYAVSRDTKKGRVAMGSVVEQDARQIADEERKQAEQREFDIACILYAVDKHDISELAGLFSLDPTMFGEACGLQSTGRHLTGHPLDGSALQLIPLPVGELSESFR